MHRAAAAQEVAAVGVRLPRGPDCRLPPRGMRPFSSSHYDDCRSGGFKRPLLERSVESGVVAAFGSAGLRSSGSCRGLSMA